MWSLSYVYLYLSTSSYKCTHLSHVIHVSVSDRTTHNIYLMEPREEVESGESEDEGDTQYDDHRDAHYIVRKDEEEDDYHFDAKARSIIDLTNQGNKLLCQWPSWVITIDEQMTRFRDRSIETETYKMSNKPIEFGYKSFSIVDTTTKFL